MDNYVTKSGTNLPLMNLKGKKYMLVAHRILWFNEEVPNFTISTEFPVLTPEETVARATITMYNNDGKIVKQASATKRETKKDFADHTEKAETGAIGRAVTLLGYGTAFALADLDEGSRIVDAPLTSPEAVKVLGAQPSATVVEVVGEVAKITEMPKKSTFRKPNPKKEDNGWT